ncbi:MAG TPA: hypothetical protein VIG33_12135, partial [Pseudobdellovibrionaceae bacterium]
MSNQKNNENSEFHSEFYSGIYQVKLDSISLFFDETPLLKGKSLKNLLNLNFSKYKLHELAPDIGSKDPEFAAPWLWSMPEVFRKKLTAYSEYYFNEVNKQNILADVVRYNFSNGMQLSSKEILRHTLQEQVPRGLLPQENRAHSMTWSLPWPLLQQQDNSFVSQTVVDIEGIVQALLDKVVAWHRQGKLDLYLQTRSHPQGALRIQAVEMDPATEVNWRVD